MSRGLVVSVFTNFLKFSPTLAGYNLRVFLTIFFVVFSHSFLFCLLRTTEVQLSHLCIRPNRNILQNTKMEATDEERKLYEAMKDLPDFDCFPIPQSWFKKFNIPPRNPVGVREYIHSNYAMAMAVAPKDLPPLIIDEPQQGGKLVEVAPPEEVPVELISKPFDWPEGKPFPAVLPSLKTIPEPASQSDPQNSEQSE